jgi:argininosuccinate synthase
MGVKEKLVLAYSGGLDTSFCLKFLTDEKGFEVHTVLVNTGGFTAEELNKIESRAKEIGAHIHINLNVENDYYNKCIKYMVFGNILKNGTYPLSVSSERTIQASAVVEYAKKIGATHIAHGSTGAGNDQVRFDIVIKILAPEIKIVTPIRDLKLSREAEIEYLNKHGVNIDIKKMAYSINKGLWGTSVGGKETLTSKNPLPDSAYPTQATKDGNEQLTLSFCKGELCKVNGKSFKNPVDAIREVESVVSAYAIGRDIHVGDTIIGIKGRVGFEAGAPLVIIKAHHVLEKHVLSKWQMYWKEQLANWYGMLLHEAQYLEPVMRDIEKFLESTQAHVTGEVYIRLAPYRFSIEGIDSAYDLMTSDFGDYGEANRMWSAEDVKGFTNIFGMSSSIYNYITNKVENSIG